MYQERVPRAQGDLLGARRVSSGIAELGLNPSEPSERYLNSKTWKGLSDESMEV